VSCFRLHGACEARRAPVSCTRFAQVRRHNKPRLTESFGKTTAGVTCASICLRLFCIYASAILGSICTCLRQDGIQMHIHGDIYSSSHRRGASSGRRRRRMEGRIPLAAPQRLISSSMRLHSCVSIILSSTKTDLLFLRMIMHTRHWLLSIQICLELLTVVARGFILWSVGNFGGGD